MPRPGRAAGVIVALALLFVAVTTGAPAALAGDGAQATADGATLWFTHRPYASPVRAFTTFPPEGNAIAHSDPGAPAGFRATWVWNLPEAPAAWRVDAGATWEATVWLSHLDEVLPIGDPFEDPLSLGSVRIGFEVLGRDETLAIATLDVSPVEAQAEATEYRLRAEFEGSHVFDDEASDTYLRIVLFVLGRGVEGYPATFQYGSAAYASRVDAPGYPLAALREAERTLLADQECALLLLQQQACIDAQEADPDDEDEVETAGAPAPALVLAVTLSLAVAGALRRRQGHAG